MLFLIQHIILLEKKDYNKENPNAVRFIFDPDGLAGSGQYGGYYGGLITPISNY
jgi:hypothetical protein